MRKMVFGLTVLAMVLVNAAASLADEASHRQATEDLLVLMDMEGTLNEVIDQSLVMELQQNPQLMIYEDVMRRFFAKYMSWQSLKDDFVKIYMDEFTEGEIRDLMEFYRTPTGQKAVEKQPVLFRKGAELGQNRVQENIPELVKMLEAETERLKELQRKEQEPQGAAPVEEKK